MKGNKEKACKDWRPVIAGMGLSGWELASIIQTPLLIQTSVSTYTMKVLFIFQRPLIKNSIEKYSRYEVKVRARPDGDYMERKLDGKYGSMSSEKTGMDSGFMRGSANHSSGYMSFRSSLNSQSSQCDPSHSDAELVLKKFNSNEHEIDIKKNMKSKKSTYHHNDLIHNMEYLNNTLSNCALEFQNKNFGLTKHDFLHLSYNGLKTCR